jgi:hypothetical protein
MGAFVVSLWTRRGGGADPATDPLTDPAATQVVNGSRSSRPGPAGRPGSPGRRGSSGWRGSLGRPGSAGILSLGTVLTVVGALSATVLGGGLATRHSNILDGNTWIVAASRDGVERLLRVNPGSGEVDLETPSPLPEGRPAQLQQSNVTTAVVDATTGDTFAWDPVDGRWLKSTTRVSGATALHLTSTAAFAVDRKAGTVQQLDPRLLSAPIGAPVSLGAEVSESVVDGSGKLWLAAPQPRRVVSVQAGDTGPAIVRDFTVPSSGSALSLTALRSGVLAGDAVGRTTYRLFPERSAAERIAGVPPSNSALSAATSDDDTGAVLDQQAGTLTRVTPVGDERAQSLQLSARISDHTLGRPVVFGNRVYLPDYTTGTVLRSTTGGAFETFPPRRTGPSSTPGEFDMFVDDDRLWVNSRTGARAFSIDRAGNWTPITKFEKKKIRPPKAEPTRQAPTKAPDEPANTGRPDPAPERTGRATGRPDPTRTRPQAEPTATPTITETPSPTPSETASPTASPTPSPTPAAPPGAPANLTAAPGAGSLTVNWQPPAEGADSITGYRVEWTGPDGTQSADLDAEAREHVIPDLQNGVEYQVSVVAVGPDESSEPAVTSATPVTTAEVALNGARASGIGQVTVEYTVDTRNSGGVNCAILLNGEPKWEGGCAGASTQNITGLAFGTGFTVAVRATNAQGTATSTEQSVTTWARPTVTISKGQSAVGDGNPTCTDPSCAYITVRIQNFTPNTTYTMNGTDTHDPTPLPNRPITAGADGSATLTGPGKTYFYGFRGEEVTIRVGGFASAPLRW